MAHAIGNVELQLHEWDVDFAAWCSYKYLNSGAGSIAGIFVHEKHFEDINEGKLKKLDGWWSHEAETRFEMTGEMKQAKGALAYNISNPPILLCASLRASLNVH